MKITAWNGKPINKPGWYSGIPIERYHSPSMCSGRAVSSTDLRTCWSKSPAHMFVNWAENPRAEPKRTTAAMILGAAAHHIILGEDGFNVKYPRQPLTYRDRITAQEKPWHGGAIPCKQWTEKQHKAGKTPVTPTQLVTIREMSRSLAANSLVQVGVLRGHVELSGFCKDQETGLWIKIRPDVLPIDSSDFVDLKTAHEVTTPALQSAIRSRAYHQQGALIWEVAEALEPEFQNFTFTLIFVETGQPYCTRSVEMTQRDLLLGRLQNRAMLRKISSCINGNHWPGPGEGDTHKLPLANDEANRIEQRLKYEGLNG